MAAKIVEKIRLEGIELCNSAMIARPVHSSNAPVVAMRDISCHEGTLKA
jgi:hypothetical protein